MLYRKAYHRGVHSATEADILYEYDLDENQFRIIPLDRNIK